MPAPTLSFQWFNSKRGLASAVVYAGTGEWGCVESIVSVLNYHRCQALAVRRFPSSWKHLSMPSDIGRRSSASYALSRLITILLNFNWSPLQAIGYGILGILALTFIKPRLPVVSRPEDGTRYGRPMNSAFLRRSSFYAFGGAILFTSFGNFVPFIYLPGLSLSFSAHTILDWPTNFVNKRMPQTLVSLRVKAPY